MADFPDRQYILDGVRDGFHIVDISQIPDELYVDVNNYSSATNTETRQLVEKKLKEELLNGHYIFPCVKPQIISAIGAIPKKDSGDIRIIHDCSRPLNSSLNSFAVTEKFSYQTIQQAVDLISPGCWLMKIDLQNAYRSVKIHSSNYTATGIKWMFEGDSNYTIMADARMSFGASRSPQIFEKLSQAVCAIMRDKYNVKIVGYLDDYLCIADSYMDCLNAVNNLMKLLRRLGFSINYKKIEGPSNVLTFLGISLNTLNMTLELPETKLCSFKCDLMEFRSNVKVTKRQIQSILGKVNWATQCIYGGRFHMRRLLDKMCSLKKPWHRSRVTKDMKADIDWWIQFMDTFNGLTPMVECRPAAPVCIDACNVGAGAYYSGMCLYTPWSAWEGTYPLHINMKEVLALEPAANCWAPFWTNKKIFVHTDNITAASIINKGMAKEKVVMNSLRRIFWLSAKFNFRLQAVYYPGIRNVLADCISRIEEPGAGKKLDNALQTTYVF